MAKLNDNDPFPFGKYKGDPMDEVPDSYLLYLWNENIKDGNVREYIVENLDAIKHNVEFDKSK